jgi:hypothetical protein
MRHHVLVRQDGRTLGDATWRTTRRTVRAGSRLQHRTYRENTQSGPNAGTIRQQGMKTLSHNSQFPTRDLNSRYPQHKSGALPNRQRREVVTCHHTENCVRERVCVLHSSLRLLFPFGERRNFTCKNRIPHDTITPNI